MKTKAPVCIPLMMMLFFFGCGHGHHHHHPPIFIEDIDTYSASGSYSYNSATGNLRIDYESSGFEVFGPRAGEEQEWTVISLSDEKMTWEDRNRYQMKWRRVGMHSQEITGTWKYCDDSGLIYQATFGSDGSLFIVGGITETDWFEFEFEHIIPDEPGEYEIGWDFTAIDFENRDTSSYNLHAYSGTVTITSVDPFFEGTFEVSGFARDHGAIQDLTGSISGSFSVPRDGGRGTFVAHGIVGRHDVNIRHERAYLDIHVESEGYQLGIYGDL